MDSGVEFVAVDNPHANKLAVHILAAVAQHEREMIAQRTKDALQAAKARGVALSNPKLADVRDRAVASVKADAERFAKNIARSSEKFDAAGGYELRASRGTEELRASQCLGCWTIGRISSIG